MPRHSPDIYLVVVTSDNPDDYYAFRTESVAQRYADKVNRLAEETDEGDLSASVWVMPVRTAREMPEWPE
jgi:hypothetical protein